MMIGFSISKTMSVFVLSHALFVSTISFASPYQHSHEHRGNGNYHSHNDGYGYRGHYYDRGDFYFGGSWGRPNIIINVPSQPYYAPPVCETVQVCDTYADECWLEQRCL